MGGDLGKRASAQRRAKTANAMGEEGKTMETRDDAGREEKAPTTKGGKRKRSGTTTTRGMSSRRSSKSSSGASTSSEGGEGGAVQVLFEGREASEIRRRRGGATVSSDAMTGTPYGDTPPAVATIDARSKRTKLTRFYIEGNVEMEKKTTRARAGRANDADGHLRYALGDALTNEYKIISLLGEGTFGRVLECWDAISERRCAIKVIRNVQKYRDAAMVEIEVLKTLAEGDASRRDGERFNCIALRRAFDYQGHVCMVFDKCGPSLYDFLRSNRYKPFHPKTVQSFCEQTLVAVRYLHTLGLVHTDLKPENILLMSSSYLENATYRVPVDHTIRLIDFGSTTFVERHHSAVVSTRHYRAPEIILGLGWSYPCDMWSIGCIMIELLTGEALFQTHDNLEHVAMMQHALESAIPVAVARRAPKDKHSEFFTTNGSLNWPNDQTDNESYAALGKTGIVRNLIDKQLAGEARELFYDLISRLLNFDPKRRLTSNQAVTHPFFSVNLDQMDWKINTRNGSQLRPKSLEKSRS